MTVALLLLPGGIAGLVLGAGLLVDGSGTIAQRLRVPPIAIGLTIVAFGTSAPELVVSIFASLAGSSDVVLGNIVGSNIFNTLLIVGAAALVRPLSVSKQTTWLEIPLSLLAAIVLIAVAQDVWLDGVAERRIQRSEGVVLLAFFIIFMVYTALLMRGGTSDDSPPLRQWSTLVCVLVTIGGIVLLVAGGRAVVYAATELARTAGISERVIGLTIVSAGTSLPELVTSIVAARRGRLDLAVGNVVGSNIFNIFGILGISATVRSLDVGAGSAVDMVVNAGAGVLLFLCAYFGPGKRISRTEGGAFVALYLGYLIFLLVSVDGSSA